MRQSVRQVHVRSMHRNVNDLRIAGRRWGKAVDSGQGAQHSALEVENAHLPAAVRQQEKALRANIEGGDCEIERIVGRVPLRGSMQFMQRAYLAAIGIDNEHPAVAEISDVDKSVGRDCERGRKTETGRQRGAVLQIRPPPTAREGSQIPVVRSTCQTLLAVLSEI